MKKSYLLLSIFLAAVLLLGPAAGGVRAQEADAQEEGVSDEADFAKSVSTDTSDKTGTNPINFQHDLRIYNEYTWLNTEGDGNQNLTTLEFRTPFASGKWQLRVRAPYSMIKADFNGDGINDIDDGGLGDINFRLMTVPYVKGANAVAVGMDVFLNTASEDSLGAGATSLAPVVFFGHFFQGGWGPWKKGGLFAPGLQYKFSIDEDVGRDEVEQIIIDINYLAMSENGKTWLFVEPQIVFDQVNDVEFAIMDIEFGFMTSRPGQSWYIRPTFTLGSSSDRSTDYGIEIAYKWVGW
jgi:hypothetical protein